MSKPVRLILASDSHGNSANLRAVLQREAGADALLFLGDGLSDLAAVRQSCVCPVVYEVRGNCDHDFSVPQERVVRFPDLFLFMTHGSGYGVKNSLQPLLCAAREHQASIALFGHTHQPYCRCENGLWVFNPGSVGLSETGRATYAILTITGAEPAFELKEVH